VLNVTSESSRVVATYFVALLMVGFGVIMLLQKYRLKYDSWKQKLNPTNDFSTDADIAHYSIKIDNLPTNQAPDVLANKINAVLKQVFNEDSDSGPFIKVRVLGDYERVYDLCV
jgi:hypothetical protein